MLLLSVESESQLHYKTFTFAEIGNCVEYKLSFKLVFNVDIYGIRFASENVTKQKLVSVPVGVQRLVN